MQGKTHSITVQFVGDDEVLIDGEKYTTLNGVAACVRRIDDFRRGYRRQVSVAAAK